MFPPIDEIIGWLFKLGVAGVFSFFWWGKREDKKLLNNHTKDIVRLQEGLVTEDKVREIVTEVTTRAINPMCETMEDIKKLVLDNRELTKSLQIDMAVQEGYRKAIRDMKDN